MKRIYILGSINYDMVVCTDRMPQCGETTNGRDFLGNSGGKGANQAVAVSKFGGDARLIGCVGNDAFGEICLASLEKYDVDVSCVWREQCNTGAALIILHNGDNRIILDHGANHRLNSDDVCSILKQNLREGDIFITQMEVPAPCVEAALKTAKQCGALTVFNPAPAVGVTAEMLQNSDVVIPNEQEAQSITGICIEDQSSLAQAERWFKQRGAGNVVVTLGSKGCYFEGKIFPADKVEVVDTTAAGDTFVGALAVMLSQGKTIKDSLEFCQRASMVTIQRKGAQVAIPYLEEVK